MASGDEGTIDTGAIVWDEAKRLLARQEANLDVLRTRSLGLLSATGVITGLFAAASAGRPITHWHAGFRTVAVALFIVGRGLAVLIQWPRRWGFSRALSDFLGEIAAGTPATPDDAYFNLAKDAERASAVNEEKLRSEGIVRRRDSRHVRARYGEAPTSGRTWPMVSSAQNSGPVAG